MALNLQPLEKVVEGFMDDTITITRVEDQQRKYNPATLQTELIGGVATIFSGKCFVGPMGNPGDHQYGGEHMQRTYYEFGLPKTAPLIKPNDTITVTTSLRDPLMVGRTFCVEGIIPGTFTVHRRVAAWTDQSAS